MLQRIHVVVDLRANARLFHIALRVGILLVDERPGLRAVCIFQPPVIIDNLCPEVIVRYRNRLNIWRGRKRESDA